MPQEAIFTEHEERLVETATSHERMEAEKYGFSVYDWINLNPVERRDWRDKYAEDHAGEYVPSTSTRPGTGNEIFEATEHGYTTYDWVRLTREERDRIRGQAISAAGLFGGGPLMYLLIGGIVLWAISEYTGSGGRR